MTLAPNMRCVRSALVLSVEAYANETNWRRCKGNHDCQDDMTCHGGYCSDPCDDSPCLDKDAYCTVKDHKVRCHCWQSNFDDLGSRYRYVVLPNEMCDGNV